MPLVNLLIILPINEFIKLSIVLPIALPIVLPIELAIVLPIELPIGLPIGSLLAHYWLTIGPLLTPIAYMTLKPYLDLGHFVKNRRNKAVKSATLPLRRGKPVVRFHRIEYSFLSFRTKKLLFYNRISYSKLNGGVFF